MFLNRFLKKFLYQRMRMLKSFGFNNLQNAKNVIELFYILNFYRGLTKNRETKLKKCLKKEKEKKT